MAVILYKREVNLMGVAIVTFLHKYLTAIGLC